VPLIRPRLALSLLALLAFSVLLVARPDFGSAQQDTTGQDQTTASTAGATAPTSTTPAPPDAAALSRLLQTLEDPEKRQKLIEDLRALTAATAPAASPGGQAPVQSQTGQSQTGQSQTGQSQTAPAGAPSRPNVRDQLTNVVVDQTDRITDVVEDVADALAALATLPEWIGEQVTDQRRQAFWIEIATGGIAFPILVALLARWLSALLLGRAIKRVRATNPKSVSGRVVTGIIVAVCEALTVVAVLGAGWLALQAVGRTYSAEIIATVLIWAIAIQGAVGVAARTVLAPYARDYRPVPISDDAAAYLYVWTLRISLVAIMGWALSRIALPLGASWAGARALEIGAAAVLAGLIIVLIVQSRKPLGDVIRGQGGPVRRRLADVWHLLAIVYVLIGFGIFTSGAQDGFLFLLRATGVTLAAVVAAIVLTRVVKSGLRALFDIDPDLEKQFPGLRARTNLYRPVLLRAIELAIWVIAAGVILQGWDVPVLTVFEAETRAEVLGSVLTILLVLVIGVLAWETSSSAINRMLTGTNPDGSPREASSRAKTLLPLLRRVILGALMLFGGLIILSEIGLDIGPLLAGAGVLGLAIGFGSQALVRDIITGLFILIEDTISVGDVVTAGGHTGVVEDLSIRTIKLRDLSGSMHVVPFGDVTSVVNMSKDFAYALMDIGVAYREDTDHVSAIIKEVAEDVANDPDWGWKMTEPLEMLGVNALGDSAVVIRCRVKTKPSLQWGVQREFNRRIKQRFDKEGIEIPFPHTTIYFGIDKEGGAPPARLLVEAEQRAALADATGGSSAAEAPDTSVPHGRPPE